MYFNQRDDKEVLIVSDLPKEKYSGKSEEEKLWRKLGEAITHGFRNPLVSIRTFTQLFLERSQDEEFRKDFYRIMGKDLDRLNALIDKLEKYTEPLSLNLQSEDLNSIMDEVLASFNDTLTPRNITVNRSFSPELPRRVVDRKELAEAFSHIINNSIEAMPRGGTIAISTEVKKEGGEGVIIEISDTGIGMSPEGMTDLFSPFFTTRYKGLGLGLPLTQKIIEAHQGTFEVDSILGKGTSCRVFLPGSPDMEKESKATRGYILPE